MISAALSYIDLGYSIIPVQANKKPYVKWTEFQKNPPNREQVTEWWEKWPDAMIGMVSGKVSGIYLVDADSSAAGKHIRETCPDIINPQVKTPNGWHWWFKSDTEIQCHNFRNSAGVDIDVKGDGGYGIVPPSKANGKAYRFLGNADLIDVPKIPTILYNYINKYSNTMPCNKAYQGVTTCNNIGDGGRRDEDLFRLANCLVQSPMRDGEIVNYLEFYAKNCTPPFPEAEMQLKIKSAMDRSDVREKSFMDAVREWCVSQGGTYTSQMGYIALQCVTRNEKAKLRNYLKRLVDNEEIVKDDDSGGYRNPDVEVEWMDIENASTDPFHIKWPFGLNDHAKIPPGSIVVVSGEQSAGKTAFLLNVAYENRGFDGEILFLSSETKAQGMKMRLEEFGVPIAEFTDNIKFGSRAESFDDVISPDGINLIDYLEVDDKFYLVGKYLSRIFEKLESGIAVVGLQMDGKSSVGRGGSFSLQKPELYLTMHDNAPSGGILTITKARWWGDPERNPRYLKTAFTTYKGCQMHQVGDWYRD